MHRLPCIKGAAESQPETPHTMQRSQPAARPGTSSITLMQAAQAPRAPRTRNSICSCSGTSVAREKAMATRCGDTGSYVASTVKLPRTVRSAVKLNPTSFTCAVRALTSHFAHCRTPCRCTGYRVGALARALGGEALATCMLRSFAQSRLLPPQASSCSWLIKVYQITPPLSACMAAASGGTAGPAKAGKGC